MENYAKLSEKIEDQFEAMDWVEEEVKRIKRELGEQLGRELSAEVREYWRTHKEE